jgi:hypothetical protein
MAGSQLIKEVMKNCYPGLSSDLSPDPVARYLWGKNVITHREMEQILSRKDKVEKREGIIDTLMTK